MRCLPRRFRNQEVVMRRVRPLLVSLSFLLPASAVASRTLFGLRNPGHGGRQVVIVDPASAAVTPVSASIAPPNAAPSGVSALDGPGNRFFFVGTPGADPNQHIYTVNTATGALLSSPVVSAGVAVLGMVYDEGEGKLFIWQN